MDGLTELTKDFRAHITEDAVFQAKALANQEATAGALGRLERNIEKILNKLDPDSPNYILKETNEKLDSHAEKIQALSDIRKGFKFSGNLITGTAQIVGALSAITVFVYGLLRFILNIKI